MGETMAESLRDQIEIEKSISFENSFKESVSFGRFENDLLPWERWSSFSQNKYLEEVGKCSTPGSVAKKKAYFEAHYKKIAARKAEMDQEEEMGDGMFVSDTPSNGNSISNGCATKLEFDSLDRDETTRSMEPENNSIASTSEERNQDAVGVDSQGSSTGSGREKVDDLPDSPKSNEFDSAALVKDEDHYIDPDSQSEEMFELMIEDNIQKGLPAGSEQVGVLVQEENDRIESQDPLKLSHQLDNETGHTEENKTKDAKSKPLKELQKRTPASKNKNLVNTKRKPVAPIVKKTHASLPRVSKPALDSPAVSMSKISTKKETSSPLLKKGSPLAVKKRAPMPNAMHKLPNVEPTKFDCVAPATARRSFIMENMGDKDIVKRAFKAFQNNFSSSKPSTEYKSPIHQQVPTKTTRLTSTSVTPQKNKERVKKEMESTSYERKQVGARASSVVVGNPVSGVGKNSAKSSPYSFGLKSDERDEKHKELSKKLEKSSAKEAVRPRLLSQTKAQQKKDAESKRQSQSLNSKGTSMPDVQRVAKTRGNKVGASHDTHHQPDSLG